MSTEKHIQEFDELIREMASGAETPVPPSVWEGVGSGTSGAAGTGAAGVAGKAIIAKWAAIVAGAAIVVTAAVTLLNQQPETLVSEETVIVQSEDDGSQVQEKSEEVETISGSGGSELDREDQVSAEESDDQLKRDNSVENDNSGNTETVEGEATHQESTETPVAESDADDGRIDTPVEKHTDVPYALEMADVVCEGTAAYAKLRLDFDVQTYLDPKNSFDNIQWFLDGKLVAQGLAQYNFYFPRSGKRQLTVRFTENERPVELQHSIDVQRTNASIVSESEKGKLILRAQGDVSSQRWFVNNVEVSAVDGVVEYECENYTDHKVALIAANDNGCRDTIEESIECTWVDKIDVDAPNIFSPYIKDGKNDYFEIRMDPVKTYHMQITDTRGKVVFETTDQNEYWNGQLMNEGDLLPEGWYNYVLKYGNGGNEEVKYGRLILVK